MGDVLATLDEPLIDWIGKQHVFFVATAPSDGGHVNLSPKGHDALRVLDGTTVAYLDLTGSGAETIAHTRENGRLTIMLCAFEGPPRILRLYGQAQAHPLGSPRYAELIDRFEAIVGARAIVELAIERVQTSCGYSIPFMDYREERPTLQQWAARKGHDGLRGYWAEKNAESIDGLPALD
jgi:Pyridoxamine 5'-phosphate oxidase